MVAPSRRSSSSRRPRARWGAGSDRHAEGLAGDPQVPLAGLLDQVLDVDRRPLGVDDRALQKALIEVQKVAIMPGYTYGEEGVGFVRLNAGCPREKLEKGVNGLIAALRALA